MIDWISNNSGTVVTLGLFSSFAVILLWAFMPSKQRDLEQQAMIPFKEHTDE